MACHKKWTNDELSAAIEELCTSKKSIRAVALEYGIPKSTLCTYVSGNVEIGCKPGPDTILTTAEEEMLVNYAIHMSEIGYGCTKEQILLTVKKILDTDHRPNPFKANKPGKKWWELFKKRHPTLSLRTPEHLQLCRVQSCTPEVIKAWFHEYDQFLLTHNLKDCPMNTWNADESGFALCPKSGKVLALKSSRGIYGVTGNTKENITTLCAASASGNVIPPMHIFSGERFKSNPLEGAVAGAYCGRSPNGWMSTELFYGWIANHFSVHVPERPILLLVDGHSTHIDVEVSKLCRELGIFLYCLPPHASHLIQPLDVGFFSSLKYAWGKACENYKRSNPSVPITKYSFASVFREAWHDCVKPSMFIKAFKECGLCPFNPHAISKAKLLPSLALQDLSGNSVDNHDSPQQNPLFTLEKMMKPDTINLFEKRLEESYDVETDELFSIWSKLKQMSITKPASDTSAAAPIIPERQKIVSPVLDQVLVYPQQKQKPGAKQTKGKATSQMPKHLTSDQIIAYLQEKKDKKEREESEKEQRKLERAKKKEDKEKEIGKRRMEQEQKKKEREQKKERKRIEKEEKEQKKMKKRTVNTRGNRGGRQGGRGHGMTSEVALDTSESEDAVSDDNCRGNGTGRGSREKRGRGVMQRGGASIVMTSSSSESNGDDDVTCPVCGLQEKDSDDPWIACDNCDTWYHVHCSSVSQENDLDNIDWMCIHCENN